MNTEYINLDIDTIVIKSRRRKDLGDLSILEGSIRRLGVLKPVIIGNDNVLIAGERRLAACRNIGLDQIPAVKVDVECDSITALNIQVDLNLCRKQFSSEELDAIIEMKKSLAGESPKENLCLLSKTKAWFAEIIKYFKKPST